MKYFKIEGHFKLPDDFTGGIEEALLLMISYAKQTHNSEYVYNQDKSMYENWWYMIHQHPDSKSVLAASIQELGIDNNWNVIKDTHTLKDGK